MLLLHGTEMSKSDFTDASSGLSSQRVLLELEGFRESLGDGVTAGNRPGDVAAGNRVDDGVVGPEVFFLAARADFGNLDF